jgi:hypothetical protein
VDVEGGSGHEVLDVDAGVNAGDDDGIVSVGSKGRCPALRNDCVLGRRANRYVTMAVSRDNQGKREKTCDGQFDSNCFHCIKLLLLTACSIFLCFESLLPDFS